ncbi:response regulator [Streptomyces sp. NPDC008125]|uniref:response regulator transcription factor n=1 Tax=Streptomyces sp. NPDC008125 TaxID=3364811 RepID=UPI0036E4D825
MLRVLLAEDEHLIRAALVALLGTEPDIRVVAETGQGVNVLALVREHRPDVAVIDINLLDSDGLDVAAQLHEHCPNCRTLLLTSLDRPGTVRRAMDLGVWGYLLKGAPPTELAEAIRKVATGRRVFDPTLVVDAWQARANPLTLRELEILRLAAAGWETRTVAERTQLSIGTIRNYLSSAVSKIGARNRLDAVRIARELGWLSEMSEDTSR